MRGAHEHVIALAEAKRRDGRSPNAELPLKINTISASASEIKQVPLERRVFGGPGAPVAPRRAAPLAHGLGSPNLQDGSLGARGWARPSG